MRNVKMKKFITLFTLLTAFSSMPLLSGCTSNLAGVKIEWPDSQKQAPQAVSFVSGIHDYAPAVSFDSEAIQKQVYEACYTYGTVSMTVIDGEPFVACSYEIDKPDKNIDDSKRRQIAKENTRQILAEFSKAEAKTPEYDPLTGISLSADALQGSPTETEKTMVILDSGLSTASYLNFLESNLFDTPAETVVDKLEELHAIPDLDSIHIVWIGLSKTCGEQDPLDSDHKHKLEALWEAILKAGGAESITFDKTPVSSQGYGKNLPPCSMVPIESANPDFSAQNEEAPIPSIVKWDGNSRIRFQGDSAEFVDKGDAEQELAPIAEYLKANPHKTIYLFGMTASIAGGDANIPLSEARAQACKHILTSKNVPPGQLMCVGLGQLPNQQRVNDLDENGMQIEALAQKNRAVIMADSESPIVELLLSCLKNQ